MPYGFRRLGWRLRGTLAGLSLAAAAMLTGCNVSDDILSVTDPDVINPTDVNSASGAEAVRIGALSRFIGTTSGTSAGTFYETLFGWSGLLADEWRTGDTFIQRVETDQRSIQVSNSGITNGFRDAYRARLAAEQAVRVLQQFAPTAPAWQVAEMYFVQAYVETMLGEYFCSGIPFSTVTPEGEPQYGKQLTTQQTFERALAHADTALSMLGGTIPTADAANSARVRNASTVLRGRILLDLNRPAEAAAAVAEVPTTFAYVNQHSETTRDNVNWSINTNTRRYTVATNEGGNGLAFATANDPRLPVCLGGSAACTAAGVTQTKVFNTLSPTPLYAQLKWPTRDAEMAVVDGVGARLIEAEAALDYGNSDAYLPILNALRASVTGLDPLTDPGTPAARVDQLFRERGFWQWGTGHRLGDLRRLIRYYERAPENVFPVGPYPEGGTYGTDVNLPIPQAEENNPEVQPGQTCFDREA